MILKQEESLEAQREKGMTWSIMMILLFFIIFFSEKARRGLQEKPGKNNF